MDNCLKDKGNKNHTATIIYRERVTGENLVNFQTKATTISGWRILHYIHLADYFILSDLQHGVKCEVQYLTQGHFNHESSSAQSFF